MENPAVVHPLQDAKVPNAATTPGFALTFAHDRKIREAEEDMGIAFIPMVAESFGGWHSAAEQEVKKLGTALARHTGKRKGKQSLTSGVDSESCCKGAMQLFWPIVCQPCLGPSLMASLKYFFSKI